MAIVQALLAILSRSAGKIVSSLFGWAVVALFGHTSGREKIWLSVLVGAAAVWPVLLVGIAWPRAAAFVLAFVPFSASVPRGAIRLAWTVLAVLVPFALGLAVAMRSRPAAVPIPGSAPVPARAPAAETPLAEPWIVRLLRGVPLTMAISASFWIMFVIVPAQRIASMARRRVDVQVPLVTDTAGYPVVAAEIEQTLDRHGLAVEPAPPPWAITASSRILLRLGGPSFRAYVPEHLAYFRGKELEVVLYPAGLLLRGSAQDTAWAHGVVVEALSDAPAYQTFDPRAQDIERQIRGVWRVYRENAAAHRGSAALESRLREIARDIRALPADYDEWQIVYRQALQLGRVLHGEPQLLETTGRASGAASAPEREETQMTSAHGGGEHGSARNLSTRELIGEIGGTVSLLIQKEVALATAEIQAVLASHIALAKRVAIGLLTVLLGLNLLLVGCILVAAPLVAPWLAALVAGGALLLGGAGLACMAWTHRMREPMALTRKTLKEDMQWAKERLA